MAKSQLRSGREPKKPKKQKVKDAPASTSLWSTTTPARSGKEGVGRSKGFSVVPLDMVGATV
jgi:hypothetical protein